MRTSLKPLDTLVQVKTVPPETTPSLRDAISAKKARATVECYYFTPTLRQYFKEILDSAVHKKGQGYWVQAEYGAGKTHFLAVLTLLLTHRAENIWSAVHDEELRSDYAKPVSRLNVFPVTFSLLGAGETDAEDKLMRRFEKEIEGALPAELRDKLTIVSDDLAAEWYGSAATKYEKVAIEKYFEDTHRTSPDEYRQRFGARRFGAEIRKVGLSIELKGAFRERFAHIYRQLTQHGYDGMLFVVDEFRSWQDRHEGKPSFEEGCQVLETLGYYLPVEEQLNIQVVVASQGDIPQKLMGAKQGDRFVARSLLADRNRNDYGEIVAHRVRDLKGGAGIEIDEYFKYCRDRFKFLKQAQTSKEYFRAIFPFQPRCFEISRRITQSFDRHGLPSARAGINMAYETLQREGVLSGTRLVVASDLLASEQMRLGLRADHFRAGYESYQAALDVLQRMALGPDEQELARRTVGTLYLWAVVLPEGARSLTLSELAEATMTSLEGLTPEDAILDIVTRLKSEIPQLKYEREKGARFEVTEGDVRKPERIFGPLKKKAKANAEAQDKAWRESLFWDFKAIGGAGSQMGLEGGIFDGLATRDAQGNLVLPATTPVKTTRVNRVTYGGEVTIADKWSSVLGDSWANRPELHFRLVYLTQRGLVSPTDISDPRVAVCLPAALSDDTRENLAEFAACDDMLKMYNEKDYPTDDALRTYARDRRQRAIAEILKNQLEEFRRGEILTAKGLAIQAEEVFKAVPKGRGGREEDLGGRLLEKAYDGPLFNPKEFKKDFTDADARKVFHGLFLPVNARSNADNSARENFGSGLGLVAKTNPADFAPQDGGALGWIQERIRQKGDVALADLVKELCRPPYGLTEAMVTLFALCAVRAGDPALVLSELNLAANFTLTTGKPPMSNKLTAATLSHVEWSNKLEKTLLGARLKLSDEKSFNDILDYARVLNPDFKTVTKPDEEIARNDELMHLLKGLSEDLPAVKASLTRMASLLGEKLGDEVNLAFGHLTNMAATSNYQEFHEVARSAYPSRETFRDAWALYERARKFGQKAGDIQALKTYLDGCADLGDPGLEMDRTTLLAQVKFGSIFTEPTKLGALEALYQQFRERYVLAYRKAHRDYHETLGGLKRRLTRLDAQLTAISRLNALELGSPRGAGLPDAHRRLLAAVEPCVAKDDAKVSDYPICQICKWDGRVIPPVSDVEEHVQSVTAGVADLCGRVAQGAVRKVLEQSPEPRIKTLLEIITAAQADKLVQVLTPDLVDKVKELLRNANLEHRDLPVRDLLGDLTALEEGDIDRLLQQIGERLRAAFGKAKAETQGKKRIRFFLK